MRSPADDVNESEHEAMKNPDPSPPSGPVTPRAPLPRYRRAAADLPGLVLQARDLALLSDVGRFGLLTTSQLELLRSCDPDESRRFPSRLPLTRRLKLLFHHGHLRRLCRPCVQGSLEPVYLLDRLGAGELRKQAGEHTGEPGSEANTGIGGIEGGVIRARSPSQLPKLSALDHLLTVVQFRVAVTAACAHAGAHACAHADSRNRPAELLRWHSCGEVSFRATLERAGERTRSVTLKPDGAFVLRVQGHRLFFFVEADRGSEPGQTLLDKCAAYASYWREGGFARDFSVPQGVGFRVLFTVPSSARAETLLRAASTLEAGRSLVWVTEEENVTGERVLTRVFRGVDATERQGLLGSG